MLALAALSAAALAAACAGKATPLDPNRGVAVSLAVDGDTAGLSGAPGAPLATPFGVRAVDANGAPVAGTAVVWTVLTGGGAVAPDTATTGPDGVAHVSWTLGPDAGRQEVRAQLASVGALGPSVIIAVEAFEADPDAP